jgi:peptidoglycan hydrolase CwlO-like protein
MKIIDYNNEEKQENTTNIYLANQKVQFIENELTRTKDEVNNLNSKNENYIKQIDELKNQIFSEKQNVQSKQYEVEKGQFEIKILNSKINDLK